AQGRVNGWSRQRPVRQDQRRDQFRQVVTHRRQRQIVGVDRVDLAGLGDDEVSRVAVLVEGGRPLGGLLQQRQQCVQGPAVRQVPLFQPSSQGSLPGTDVVAERDAVTET